jgi:radical SAM superfamily enzyme YgiQ (UPF0313 family)
MKQANILLSTLNARFQHASLGLRYLYANLNELQSQAHIGEFVMGTKAEVIVEQVLAYNPRIVGFGVYIWNVEEITTVIGMLKAIAPEIKIVLGGPEVSFANDLPDLAKFADYIITGQGDVSFYKLCKQLLEGPKIAQQLLQKIIPAEAFELDQLKLPYQYYSDEDIRKRYIYVEASRGCPFKCEFCLSSLDKTATPFDLDQFLAEMEGLYARGARTFKFVDRTFNLNIKASQRIMQFFLDKLALDPNDPVFAHFELVPDHLPAALRETILKFPPGALQFEIGIQTFNPVVQTLISRRQNDEKAEDNIRWLAHNTNAHLHVDLIAGLPGETLESFGAGINRLYSFGPHEIQLGVLKRLRGTPIIRHTEAHNMRYNWRPPYNVLATDALTFAQTQRLTRLARYWDLIVNSGRFPNTLPHLLSTRPFERFLAFSDWLYAKTDATHQIAMERLFDLVYEFLTEFAADTNEIAAINLQEDLTKDYWATKAKGRLSFMAKGVSIGRNGGNAETPSSTNQMSISTQQVALRSTPKRQARFVKAEQV